MILTPVTTVRVSMTREDLKVVALTLAKTIGADKKIQVIKAMREVTADVMPVDEFGNPLRSNGEPCTSCGKMECFYATPGQTVTRFGLKECKEALDAWYSPDSPRTFLF
jgi:hypothetical protein